MVDLGGVGAGFEGGGGVTGGRSGSAGIRGRAAGMLFPSGGLGVTWGGVGAMIHGDGAGCGSVLSGLEGFERAGRDVVPLGAGCFPLLLCQKKSPHGGGLGVVHVGEGASACVGSIRDGLGSPALARA